MSHLPFSIPIHAILTVSAGLLALALSACGNSRTPDSESTPAPTFHTTVMESKIVLDPTLPPTVIGAVSKVVSPFQEGKPGTIIAIPSSGGNGDTLVFAMDAQDNVLLAAKTADTSTVLSVESTAVAFVRMALGGIPDQISPSQLNTDIRTTAAFSRLTSSISAALAVPSGPAADASVQSTVGDVLVELGPVLASRLAAAQRATKPILLATLQYYPSVISPFPYSLTNSGADRVEITNANYLVSNQSLITYSLISTASPTEILLEGTPATDRLIGNLKTTTLPNNGGRGFNVTVGQTDASKQANVIAISSDILANLISEILGEQKSIACLIAAEKAFLLPKDIAPVVQSPSVAAFGTLLYNSATAENVRSIIKGCVDLSNNADIAIAFTKAYIGISTGYYEAKAALNGTGTLIELVQFKSAVNRAPITNGVCETSNLNGPAIVNCAMGFKFDPEPQMTVGQTLTPNVVAVDRNGVRTALPAHLQFSSMNPDLATVDPDTGAVTAVKDGFALIRITDPSTGQYSAAEVRIGPIQGAILPSMPFVAVGGTLQLTARFTDSNGNVISPPSALLWSSVAENVAHIDQITGLVTGVAVGTSFVTVKLQGTTTAITTTVTVGPSGTISCTDKGIDPFPLANGNHLWMIDMSGEVSGNVGDFIFMGGTGATTYNRADAGDMTCTGWTYQAATSNRVAMCVRMLSDPASTRWTGTQTQWFNGPLGGTLFGTPGTVGGSPGGQWFLDAPDGSLKQRVVVGCPVPHP